MSAVLRELRRIGAIALPVALTQATLMTLWIVDTKMLFGLSVEAQDAAALGRSWIAGISLVGLGLCLGLDPIMSQAWGARDRRRLGSALQQGLLLSLLLSVPVGLAFLFTEEFLLATRQDPALARAAEHYVLVQLPALPAVFAFGVLRQYLNCRGIVAPPLVVGILANFVNALGNWMFIYGHGVPELGVTGAGLATALTEIFMVAALAVWIRARGLQRAAWMGWNKTAWNLRGLLPVLALGLPIAIQLGLELWGFQIATLWAGLLGDQVTPLASHNIALQLASLSFMLPLGISIGAAARVGNLIGAGDPLGARRAAWVALGLGAFVMSLCGVGLVLGREVLPAWYTDDAAVIALAAGILPIAAGFQVFDGLQVVGGGVLRGMGRTKPAAVFNFVAYYLLALPLGWWWCFERGHGLRGLWWGLGTALALVSIALVLYIRARGPGPALARVRA